MREMEKFFILGALLIVTVMAGFAAVTVVAVSSRIDRLERTLIQEK